MQMYLLSTRQNFQYRLRVENNKESSNFHDKFNNTVLLATANLWGNIQIVGTYILKYNVFNLVSFAIKYLDFETLDCCFMHISDKIIYYVLNDVEDMKKIYFPIQKHICYNYTFGKIY